MQPDSIDMDRTDAAGQHIVDVLIQASRAEVPKNDNKAKAMYVMASSLVRGMQLVASLVGWPGENFGPKDDRRHLGMYDYINDVSKTFAALVVARLSREDAETTVITASPDVLGLALRQTEMIHGSVEGKIDPAILNAIKEFGALSPAAKKSLMVAAAGQTGFRLQ